MVQMNLFTAQKYYYRCRKLVVTKEGIRAVINWETGIDIHTLLDTKKIREKNILYSTRNSAHYSTMTYMGIRSKKRVDICNV